MEAVNDMSVSYASLHYGGLGAGRAMASYWTRGPGQFSGNPLNKVGGAPDVRVLERHAALKLRLPE